MSIRQSLLEATEKLNKAIEAKEKELQELGYGVQFFVKIPDIDSNIYIGYTRVKSEWHICMKHKENDGEETFYPSLTHAPRALRLIAFKHFDLLVPAFEETAISLTNRINKALSGEE